MEPIFSEGADLWVIPDIHNSPWKWSLEWSSNFQISKSLNHPAPEWPAQALDTFKNWEADDFVQKDPGKAYWTLISVDKLLPTKWLVYSTQSEKPALVEALDKLWRGLDQPSTRLFIPKEWTQKELKGLKSDCLKNDATEIISAKEA